MDSYEIVRIIKESKKKTPYKCYIKSTEDIDFKDLKFFGNEDLYIVFAEKEEIEPILEENKDIITSLVIENDARNSAIPMLDIKNINARIEPGAIIRDNVEIGDNAVIMMGAIINIGAKIGKASMIDMGAVLGGRAEIGERCHIGAGAVIAGVVEPPSATPVVIEDDCLVGANAVVIEGVRVGKGSVVAAGAVVIEDVPAGVVVGGVPARILKKKDEKTSSKSEFLDDLRKI